MVLFHGTRANHMAKYFIIAGRLWKRRRTAPEEQFREEPLLGNLVLGIARMKTAPVAANRGISPVTDSTDKKMRNIPMTRVRYTAFADSLRACTNEISPNCVGIRLKNRYYDYVF